MNISAKLSTPSTSSKLTTKEENRLNEAAKRRVAKLLDVKRNMIDLTDDEPPRKQARVDSHGHMEAGTPGPAPQNGVRGSAHQALYDLLLSQSQEEARILSAQDERARRDPVYQLNPFGPPPNAPGAPGYTGGTANPLDAIRPPWGPEYYFAQPTATFKPTFRAPPGPQQHEQVTTPAAHPPAPALPSQISDFHARITRLSGPVGYMPNATKLDALKTLCNSVIEFVQHADPRIKDHLRNDKVFTEACWRIYDTLDERSKIVLLHPIGLRGALEKLEKVRDGCFVGFEEFLEAFRRESIPEWREGVRGLDDEGARRKILDKGSGIVFDRRGELEDDEDDEDADSLPGQYDSYDGMDEEEDADDL